MTTFHSIWAQAQDNHNRYSATESNEQDIRFFSLGLSGETGEALEAAILCNVHSGKIANLVKKRQRDGQAHNAELRAECADVLAYTMMLAAAIGMSPDDLLAEVARKQQVFVEKMKALGAQDRTTHLQQDETESS